MSEVSPIRHFRLTAPAISINSRPPSRVRSEIVERHSDPETSIARRFLTRLGLRMRVQCGLKFGQVSANERQNSTPGLPRRARLTTEFLEWLVHGYAYIVHDERCL